MRVKPVRLQRKRIKGFHLESPPLPLTIIARRRLLARPRDHLK